MPLLTKSKLINNTLTFKYRHCRGVVFWLKNADMVPIAQSVVSVLAKPDQTTLPDNIEILKDAPVNKRLLFRIKLSVPTRRSVVAKVLNLHLTRLRFKYCWMKYHRYGFAEAANLIIAGERGIRVPHVYGYGRINGSLGLIERDVVILEDLNHHISITELLEQNKNNERECISIINRVIPTLISHYKARCNNWDINAGSLVFDRHDSELDPTVLDLEYVVFLDKPSFEVLMFLAGRVARHVLYAADWMNTEIFYDWAARLLDRAEIADMELRTRLLERFDHYLNIPCMPHKERIKIS
jgi:hypothetical protein